MSSGLDRLAKRIRDELAEIDYTLNRAMEGLQRAKQTGDDHYLDGVALNLHGFYSGIEKIFELIAAHVDGFRPHGENWHQMLLKQMAEDMADIRPAVISGPVRQTLEEYRGFRHIVRSAIRFSQS